jgi:hypothetical protein
MKEGGAPRSVHRGCYYTTAADVQVYRIALRLWPPLVRLDEPYYHIFGARTCGKGKAVRYVYTHTPLEVGKWPCQGLHLLLARTQRFATARQRVMCRERVAVTATWFGKNKSQ